MKGWYVFLEMALFLLKTKWFSAADFLCITGKMREGKQDNRGRKRSGNEEQEKGATAPVRFTDGHVV